MEIEPKITNTVNGSIFKISFSYERLLIADPDVEAERGKLTVVDNDINKLLGENCFSYLFPHKSYSEIKILRKSYPLTEPRSGAIAFYLNQEKLVHVGKVSEDNQVISKWGIYKGVYKHRPEMVPTEYGNTIEFRMPR